MVAQEERKAAREVIANAKARTSRVSLCLDGDLNDALAAALEAFEDDPDNVELAEAVVAAEQAVKAAETEFVIQVGRGRWRKLMADYPPSDEEKESGAEFNAEFPLAAIAEFLVDPKLTLDELKQLDEDVLDEVQYAELWGAAMRAYFGGRRPPSQAARRLLNGRGSSSSASISESGEAS